jgi:hypothetical protein
MMYIINIHMAYMSFQVFRPLPLGLGWASMVAAYSGSRARWINRLKCISKTYKSRHDSISPKQLE